MPYIHLNIKSWKMAIFKQIRNQTKITTCDYITETKKRQLKNPRKGEPILAPFPSSGHSRPLFLFFVTFGHDVYESAWIMPLLMIMIDLVVTVYMFAVDLYKLQYLEVYLTQTCTSIVLIKLCACIQTLRFVYFMF